MGLVLQVFVFVFCSLFFVFFFSPKNKERKEKKKNFDFFNFSISLLPLDTNHYNSIISPSEEKDVDSPNNGMIKPNDTVNFLFFLKKKIVLSSPFHLLFQNKNK